MRKIFWPVALLLFTEYSHASSKIDPIALENDRMAILACCYSLGGGDEDAIVGNNSVDTSNKQSVKPGIDLSIKNAILHFVDSTGVVGADSFGAFLSQKNLQDRFYTAFIPKEKQIGLFKNKTLHSLDLEDERLGDTIKSDLKVRYLFIPITRYKEKSERDSFSKNGELFSSGNKQLYLDFEIYDLENDTTILNDKVNADAGSWISSSWSTTFSSGSYQKASGKLSSDLVSSMQDVFTKLK